MNDSFPKFFTVGPDDLVVRVDRDVKSDEVSGTVVSTGFPYPPAKVFVEGNEISAAEASRRMSTSGSHTESTSARARVVKEASPKERKVGTILEMLRTVLFAIFVATVSFWIWRIFLPYPWADILAILGGVSVLLSKYVHPKRGRM